MNQINTYFPIESLSNQNIIYMSHVPLILSDTSPSIEDLSCHKVNIKAICKGSLQIATTPPQADIYIYEETHGDYVLRTEKTGSMTSPYIITDIECTGPTRSNKFKLTFPGYVDIEGILDITNGTIYQLYIIMEKRSVTMFGQGDFLIPALAIGGFIFFLLGKDKVKSSKKEDYDKYRE